MTSSCRRGLDVSFTRRTDAAYFTTGLESANCPSQTRQIGAFDKIYEHDLMTVSEGENMAELVHNCMSCNHDGWWNESCMSATDRQTLPSEPIENVEDGVAPPWRCQECVEKDQYAVQRVLEVVRGKESLRMERSTCCWNTWGTGILKSGWRVG